MKGPERFISPQELMMEIEKDRQMAAAAAAEAAAKKAAEESAETAAETGTGSIPAYSQSVDPAVAQINNGIPAANAEAVQNVQTAQWKARVSKEAVKPKSGTVPGALFVIFIVCESLFSLLLMYELKGEKTFWPWVLLFLLCEGVLFFVDRKKKHYRWVHLYCSSVFLAGVMSGSDARWYLLTVACLLIAARALCFFKELTVWNIIMTVFSSLVFLVYHNDASYMQYIILAVLVISILFTMYAKTAQEILLLILFETYALIGFSHIEVSIPLGMCLQLLLMAVILFWERLRDKNFSMFAGACAVSFFFVAVFASQIAGNEYRILALTAVSGVAIIMLLFCRTYALGGSSRQSLCSVTLAVYVMYMLISLRISQPVVFGLVFGGFALLFLLTGFFMKRRSLRILGLILTMIVCVKVIVFDLASVDSAQRIPLCFMTAVLAMGAAYLYVWLEKLVEKKA